MDRYTRKLKRPIDNICSNCIQRKQAKEDYKEWLESEPKDYNDPDYNEKHDSWEFDEPNYNPCCYCTLNNIG